MINTNNIHTYRIPIEFDFHTLRSSVVERILMAADADGYRKPKNANGSRARCYFEAIKRKHKTWRKKEGLD